MGSEFFAAIFRVICSIFLFSLICCQNLFFLFFELGKRMNLEVRFLYKETTKSNGPAALTTEGDRVKTSHFPYSLIPDILTLWWLLLLCTFWIAKYFAIRHNFSVFLPRGSPSHPPSSRSCPPPFYWVPSTLFLPSPTNLQTDSLTHLAQWFHNTVAPSLWASVYPQRVGDEKIAVASYYRGTSTIQTKSSLDNWESWDNMKPNR